MNEAETRRQKIDVALKKAGWYTAPFEVKEEVQVIPGRIEHDGFSHNPMRADYVLMYGDQRLAVVEAKRDNKSAGAGETQARYYAEHLGVRFAFATNGNHILSYDLVMGKTTEYDDMIFPTPHELLDLLKLSDDSSELEKACKEIPFLKGLRYYQERAVENVIKAIGRGQKNVLLTLATGTGKTRIAHQLIKKLVEVKWSRENGQTIIGVRKPRVLFLTDRNILADQAQEEIVLDQNECCRLKPGEEELSLDRTVYFTLYQTLLGKSETDKCDPTEGIKYKKFSQDFFDLVIVDECHRGGVNDESVWRVVLDYFESAVHLGLTATPKCDANGSTYEYFGKPVYTYSLKQGIEDGFLTPFRVKKCISTLSRYHYESGDLAAREDEIDKDEYYSNNKLEREHIRIDERDRHFVHELFEVMPPNEKGIVFCVTQEHARRIAQFIREEARTKGYTSQNYCVRVTTEDGAIGEQFLKEFRNNENKIPTILTTSMKLTTGVDARNVRSIVILKNVKSMIEFKQIIGRGSRLYDGKPFFTIYDFTDATDKFNDPAWDGPSLCQKCGQNPCVCKNVEPKRTSSPTIPSYVEPNRITLAGGRVIEAHWEKKVFFENQMITAEEFVSHFVRAIQNIVSSSTELRECWADIERRKDLLDKMKNAGFSNDKLEEMQQNTGREEYDFLDIALDFVYNVKPLTREVRAQYAERQNQLLYGERKELSKVILENYVRHGVLTLTKESYMDLLKQRYQTISGACKRLGFNSTQDATAFYSHLQSELFSAI